MESMDELPDSSIQDDEDEASVSVPVTVTDESGDAVTYTARRDGRKITVSVSAVVKAEVPLNLPIDDDRQVADVETPNPNVTVEPIESVDQPPPTVKLESDPLISSSDLPSPARSSEDTPYQETVIVALPTAAMLDSNEFRTAMVDPAGYHALNGRMSPSYGSGSYATLTPLQPLPPISTVAPIGDKYFHPGNGVTASFTLMQNSYNNSIAMGLNTYQYDKLTSNISSGLGSPTHQTMIPSMAMVSNGLGMQTQNIGSPYSYSQGDLPSPKSPTTYDAYTTVAVKRETSHSLTTQSEQIHSPTSLSSLNGWPKQEPDDSPPPVTSVTQTSLVNRDRLTPTSSVSSKNGSGEMEEINTKDVAQRISAELKRYSIPQAIFAQRVLCRSQGTLSDLLRNPKPWSKLKSGRETFRRMHKWLEEPEFQRMSSLRLAGGKIK